MERSVSAKNLSNDETEVKLRPNKGRSPRPLSLQIELNDEDLKKTRKSTKLLDKVLPSSLRITPISESNVVEKFENYSHEEVKQRKKKRRNGSKTKINQDDDAVDNELVNKCRQSHVN